MDNHAAADDGGIIEQQRGVIVVVIESLPPPPPPPPRIRLQRLLPPRHYYEKESVFIFPPERSIPADYIRRLADELMTEKLNDDHDDGVGHDDDDDDDDDVQQQQQQQQQAVDKSYETVHVVVVRREEEDEEEEVRRPVRVLTRLEHFVDGHPGWSELCHTHLRELVSETLGIEMVLYKEKLNVKPPGGSGYAPHLDAPSLRIAFGEHGPRTFCTVMVAIDDMTELNGCLRICKGEWNEDRRVRTIDPAASSSSSSSSDGGTDDDDDVGNPDGGGRGGAIHPDVARALVFEPLPCESGTIAVFNGWAPHRSSSNASQFSRRAVFLTYNPKEEGDYHARYYERMTDMRREWRDKAERRYREDARSELEALSTIPK